jgi:hypothetical protein
MLAVTVGSHPIGQPLAPGFVGLSLEYPAVRQYTGPDPRAIDPVLIALIRNLVPVGRPVLRIGGHSADLSWRPQPGEPPPPGVSYALTEDWLDTTNALAVALDARMIMGLNLAADRPQLAADEATAFVRGIGRHYVEALEIGNEPDVYTQFPWYVSRHGRSRFARADYSLDDYINQFSRWRAALLSQAPVTGPALAEVNWLKGLGSLIAAAPGLELVTAHRYPLRACITNPRLPGYATIAGLLSDQASSGTAQQLAPFVAVAHRHGVAFRLDELNSASCGGKGGVSNAFASALWMLDTLFNLARIGVDGVNVHTYSGAAYASFSVKHTGHRWEAFVHPEYYGMLMFTRAFPADARLLPVKLSQQGPLKAWATEAPGHVVRLVLINKSQRRGYQVQLRARDLSGFARAERLQARGPSSTDHVTLGGMTFGDATTTGQLRGTPDIQAIAPQGGVYSIAVPPASAALVTF